MKKRAETACHPSQSGGLEDVSPSIAAYSRGKVGVKKLITKYRAEIIRLSNEIGELREEIAWLKSTPLVHVVDNQIASSVDKTTTTETDQNGKYHHDTVAKLDFEKNRLGS